MDSCLAGENGLVSKFGRLGSTLRHHRLRPLVKAFNLDLLLGKLILQIGEVLDLLHSKRVFDLLQVGFVHFGGLLNAQRAADSSVRSHRLEFLSLHGMLGSTLDRAVLGLSVTKGGETLLLEFGVVRLLLRVVVINSLLHY